jgi:hypothetical protein
MLNEQFLMALHGSLAGVGSPHIYGKSLGIGHAETTSLLLNNSLILKELLNACQALADQGRKTIPHQARTPFGALTVMTSSRSMDSRSMLLSMHTLARLFGSTAVTRIPQRLVVKQYFLAVSTLGICPRFIRTDKGTETILLSKRIGVEAPMTFQVFGDL